jgi:cysteine synthase
VGGGGLVSGVAVAVKGLLPHVRVIGIEPEVAGDAAESFARGERVTWPIEQTSSTVADGLRTGLGDLTFAHVRALVDDVLTVSEEQILDAVRVVARRARLIAEPSGAVTDRRATWRTAPRAASGDGGRSCRGATSIRRHTPDSWANATCSSLGVFLAPEQLLAPEQAVRP